MLAKRKVMSKKINIRTKNLFSLQLKKALFYAFIEARKYGSEVIDSQFLLFGLLKADDNLTSKLFKNIYGSPIYKEKLLSKLKLSFQIKTKSVSFSTGKEYPNFSRPIKRLLFFLSCSKQTQTVTVITTLHVFTYLLRHKYINKLIKETLINS